MAHGPGTYVASLVITLLHDVIFCMFYFSPVHNAYIFWLYIYMVIRFPYVPWSSLIILFTMPYFFFAPLWSKCSWLIYFIYVLKDVIVSMSVDMSISLSDPFQDSSFLWHALWIGFGFPFCLSCFVTLAELLHTWWNMICHRLGIALICDLSCRNGIFSWPAHSFAWMVSCFLLYWCLL